MSRIKQHLAGFGVLIAIALLIAWVISLAVIGVVSGAAPSQSTAIPGVRMAGPVQLGYIPGDANPFIDVTIAGMTNLPDWITLNPAFAQTSTDHLIPSAAIDTSGITGHGGDGLTSVATDATLSGNGTSSSPLSLADGAVNADKLAAGAVGGSNIAPDGIDGGKIDDTNIVTAGEIENLLTLLSGNSRLHISEIAPVPETPTGLGAVGDVLKVAPGGSTLEWAADAEGVIGAATLAALNARPSPTAGEVAAVYGDSAANNGIYYRTNSAWTKIANLDSAASGGLTQAQVDARIQAAAGNADPRNTSLPNSGVSDNWSREDHDHGITASGGGGGRTESQVNQQIEAYTGQTGQDSWFAVNRLPEAVQRLASLEQSGGYANLDDDTVQIAGPLVSQTAAPAAISSGLDWSWSITKGGPAIGGNTGEYLWLRIRFLKTAFATQPTVDAVSGIRLSPPPTGDPDDPEVRYAITALETRTGAAAPSDPDSGQYWFAVARLGAAGNAWPTGPSILVRSYAALTLGIRPGDGLVEPRTLHFQAGSLTPGHAVRINDNNTFDSVAAADHRVLIDGPFTGVATNGQNVAGSKTSLTETLNVRTETHGLVSGGISLSINSGASPAGLSFSSTEASVTEADIPIVSIRVSTIAGEAPFSSGNSYGHTLAQSRIYSGSDLAGVFSISIAWDERTGHTALYTHLSSVNGSISGLAFTVSGDVELVVLGFGAPRGAGNGDWYEYESLPTDGSQFQDGDLILVYGATEQGAYRKSSTRTSASSGTGMDSLTWNPRNQADSRLFGDDEWTLITRVATHGFSNNANEWTDFPTEMATLGFGFRHDTLDQGQFIFHTAQDNAYGGHIAVLVGNQQFLLNKVAGNNRQWLLTGLDRYAVQTLRTATAVRFAFPDQNDFTVTHSLDKVLQGARGGWTDLIDVSVGQSVFPLNATDRDKMDAAGSYLVEVKISNRWYTTQLRKAETSATAVQYAVATSESPSTAYLSIADSAVTYHSNAAPLTSHQLRVSRWE